MRVPRGRYDLYVELDPTAFPSLLAMENELQAAVMAPTELLAEQHHAAAERIAGADLIANMLPGGARGLRLQDALRLREMQQQPCCNLSEDLSQVSHAFFSHLTFHQTYMP